MPNSWYACLFSGRVCRHNFQFNAIYRRLRLIRDIRLNAHVEVVHGQVSLKTQHLALCFTVATVTSLLRIRPPKNGEIALWPNTRVVVLVQCKYCVSQNEATLTVAAEGTGTLFSSVQLNSHLFLSPIGARTLKMPVPYSPPNVGAYTRTGTLARFFFNFWFFFSLLTSAKEEKWRNSGREGGE